MSVGWRSNQRVNPPECSDGFSDLHTGGWLIATAAQSEKQFISIAN